MKKKNIFLFVLDGVRPDRMSCNGNRRLTTPFLDSLIKEGRYYQNAYATSHSSLPCHISIFTGIHPYFHGAASNFSYYNNNLPYLTNELKKAGYFNSGISTYNPYLSVECGFLRYFDSYQQVMKNNTSRNMKIKEILKQTSHGLKFMRGGIFDAVKYLYKKREQQKFFHHLSRFYLYNDLGGSKISALIKNEFDRLHNVGIPFFLFANILEAHTPFLPPLPYRNYFGEVELTNSLLTAFFDPHTFIEGRASLNKQEQEGLEKLYDCGLKYMDDLVKNIYEYLEVNKHLDNSLVIIMSDHSEMLNEHDRLIGHGNGSYEGMIKVPILVIDRSDPYFKGIEDKNCSITDVFPTILEAAGIRLDYRRFPYKCCGLKDLPDQRPIIVESSRIPYPERFLNFPNMILNFSHVERTIIYKKMKLIWRSDGKHKLFDISVDSAEQNNLFEKAKNGLVREMIKLMDEWYRSQLPENEFFSFEYFPYNLKSPEVNAPEDMIITQKEDNIIILKDRNNNLKN